jgi:hypothetical protein
MADIPKCDLPFGSKVFVREGTSHANDFPEVFVVSGIEWHHASTRFRSVPNDQVNITLIPMSDLRDGGADGFTPDNLRLARQDEIEHDRRNP